MKKTITLLFWVIGMASMPKAQSILPNYLLGEWELVEDTLAPQSYVVATMDEGQRISPTQKMDKEGVRFYFYPDGRYQKSIYTTAGNELILGNGKILSFDDEELIMELEEMYIKGRASTIFKSIPEMQFDTLHIGQLPPFHFMDLQEFPSATKRGVTVRDTVYYRKNLRLPADE